ncbi:MAG: MBL fold metallo-hydrolase, partial [Caldilineaceae bacterium]|nr:MBL fold metallo-hydrolase [Caldilineaceae bacterium]
MGGVSTLSPLSLEHCTIHRVVQGVYIAQPRVGGAAASNAGIVALGNQTLVFDTFWLPKAAAELRQAAEDLTNAPVRLVVNSHHHATHIGGNQVFDGETAIIAATMTRNLIAEHAPTQLAWHQHHHLSHLAELEASVLNAKGKQKDAAQQTYDQYQHLIGALPTIRVRLPDLTFEQHMVLHGSKRRVEVISYGGGHTHSDTILYLPDDGVIFMGDLLSTKRHPFLGDGDPGELPRILDLIARLNPLAIIPGHGDIGTVEDIQTMQTYLATLTETALTELAFQYGDEEEIYQKITRFAVPKLYQDWAKPEYFSANLRFLYERVMTAYAD